MHVLQPSLCEYYDLDLPTCPRDDSGNIFHDPHIRAKHELNDRTGAASLIVRSGIFVNGGATIPLALPDNSSIQDIQTHFQNALAPPATPMPGTCTRLPTIRDFLSRETFFLDLIQLKWGRVRTNNSEALHERFLHCICYARSSLYLFGGLTAYGDPTNPSLAPTNDLWKLDLTQKKWSLVASEEKSTELDILPRFNHSMHICNEFDDMQDTYIIIVGGTDHNNKKVDRIDFFNLTKNCWDLQKSIYCANEVSNVSILIANNDTKIPILAIYNKNSTACNKNSSPVVAIPLVSNTEPIRADIADSQLGSPHLEIFFNLLSPTASSYNNHFIIAGYYKDCSVENFHCFAYNLQSSNWTKINTCSNTNAVGKFWKLFVWHSHHQTLLLGTKDSKSTSNQKFDKLLSMTLPMLSHIDKSSDNTKGMIDKNAFQKLQFQNKKEHIPSTIPATQFEKYIRYLDSPQDLSALESVFPLYAMVLGKDSVEAFGKYLSDFEILTVEGDSIGIPSYLLRKRWGRYFDYILSNAYKEVCNEYDSKGSELPLLKFMQEGFASKSARSSVDHHYRRFDCNSSTTSVYENDGSDRSNLYSARSSLRNPQSQSAGSEHQITQQPDDSDRYSMNDRINTSQYPNTKIPLSDNSMTTSTDNGMVFRLPFQEDARQSTSTDFEKPSTTTLPQDQKTKYPSHLDMKPELITTTFSEISPNQGPRYSECTIPDYPTNDLSQIPISTLDNRDVSNSRSCSTNSNSSVMSYENMPPERSSTSQTSQESNYLFYNEGFLTIPLPPQSKAPKDPLPQIPKFGQGLSRNGSMTTDINDLKKSSTSLLRKSHYPSRSSLSDLDFKRSESRNSLDKEMLTVYQSSDLSMSPRRRDTPSYRGIPSSRKNSFSRSSLGTDQQPRTSVVSSFIADSTLSRTSNYSLDLDPSLTPRVLYMPWSTVTVEAFVEFFFTGKINGKWPISPVVLNLLVMSKLYEIPLLFTLISEVLFAILGRKEENLALTCSSMKSAIHSTVSKCCCNDTERVTNYLKGNEIFKELTNLQESLNIVNDGFYESDIVKKVSISASVSTTDSLFTEAAQRSPTRNSNASMTSFPVVTPASLRDSCSSVSSTAYSDKIGMMSPKSSNLFCNTRSRKKSSLNKEISFSDLPTSADTNSTIKQRGDSFSELDSPDKKIINDYFKPFDNDRGFLDQARNLLIPQKRRTRDQLYLVPQDLSNPEQYDELIYPESESSQSDFDNELGGLSLERIERELSKARIIDESIDPLLTLDSGNDNQGDASMILGAERPGLYSRENIQMGGLDSLILDNLVSPNSLPPVDSVIKSIYKTAILVNDVRLMVRCVDIIEISKSINTLKLNFTDEMKKIKSELVILDSDEYWVQPQPPPKNADQKEPDSIQSAPHKSKSGKLSRDKSESHTLLTEVVFRGDLFQRSGSDISLHSDGQSISSTKSQNRVLRKHKTHSIDLAPQLSPLSCGKRRQNQPSLSNTLSLFGIKK